MQVTLMMGIFSDFLENSDYIEFLNRKDFRNDVSFFLSFSVLGLLLDFEYLTVQAE